MQKQNSHAHFGAIVWERVNIQFKMHVSNVRVLMTQQFMRSKDAQCQT